MFEKLRMWRSGKEDNDERLSINLEVTKFVKAALGEPK